MVRPSLHHLPPLRQVFCIVISGPNAVSLRMRELPLDRIAVPSVLIKDGRSHAAEAVAGHCVFVVSEAPQSRIDGVFTHWPLNRAGSGEQVLAEAVSGERVELA